MRIVTLLSLAAIFPLVGCSAIESEVLYREIPARPIAEKVAVIEEMNCDNPKAVEYCAELMKAELERMGYRIADEPGALRIRFWAKLVAVRCDNPEDDYTSSGFLIRVYHPYPGVKHFPNKILELSDGRTSYITFERALLYIHCKDVVPRMLKKMDECLFPAN